LRRRACAFSTVVKIGRLVSQDTKKWVAGSVESSPGAGSSVSGVPSRFGGPPDTWRDLRPGFFALPASVYFFISFNFTSPFPYNLQVK